MTSKDFNNNEEFDIIDFDLNEYDEEFEKEEQKIKLKEQKKEANGSKAEMVREKLKQRENLGEPNRDMLKTILLILFLIVVACLFLGLISFIVNSTGGSKDKKERTEDNSSISTEYNHSKDSSDPKNDTNTDKEDEKQNLEDNIENITNNVINDTTEDDSKENNTTESNSEAPTTEAPTESTTTETTTEAPTTEAPTTETPTTEAPIEKTPETSTDGAGDTSISITPTE